MFEHRRDERMQSYDPDLFEYLGRTASGGKPHVTRHGTVTVTAGWLMFKHIDGTGFGNYHGAVNGGVRDVIFAWPMSEYWVSNDEGFYDENVFCLPPEKCYCFRKEEPYKEDEDDDEEEESLPMACDHSKILLSTRWPSSV
ncbi:hypothetical protein TrVE_jg5697 [Triparma verrucosa]|uniref:Uncharacterized protein n=1 Tax=Triparma verrucosa TaxID=1606542 RepID=A0A9W7F820_9STRA|nr:hypothetical protein TrVE_jg5697 [Triparma verrucosa]